MSFQLFNLDPSLFPKKMREVFKDLVDVNVSYPQRDYKEGFLRSIPSNYGYVSFWFGFLDEDALSKYYRDYLSQDKLREIEEAKRKKLKQYQELGISKELGELEIKDLISDILFPLVYEHPDTIGNGNIAEVYLAIVSENDLKDVSIDKATWILKDQAERLEKLRHFEREVSEEKIKEIEDMEIKYETIKFVDENASDEVQREGWKIKLSITFDGDETLREIIERIDKAISPLKESLTRMIRYEASFSPF